MSRQLNLNIRTKRQLMHRNTSPARFRLLREEGLIDLVHGGKVLHVGQENIDFDHVVDVASGCFEDLGEVS